MSKNLSQCPESNISSFLSELILPLEDPSSLPSVTIIIPTFNCSQALSLTLESIINQSYPHIEILVIDTGSTDRTLEILYRYQSYIHLSSAPAYDIYPILNQSIALAKGDYLNILFPGDAYVHPKTLLHMMSLAAQQEFPHLIYCGTLLRNAHSEAKFLFHPLNHILLKRGEQPTSLQACWFKKELFKTLGNFRTDFRVRGEFDLFCRFSLSPSLRYASLKRAFVSFDLPKITSSRVIRHFWETAQILYTYFGGWEVIKWLMKQKEAKHFAKLWFQSLRMAFVERK